MIRKWVSRSGVEDESAVRRGVATPRVSTSEQNALEEGQSDWDSSTRIVPVEPATLATGQRDPDKTRAANAFEAATMVMNPGAGFEQATIVASARPSTGRTFPDLPLPAAHVLNNRYEVIKPIGRGGFSYIYLCQHRRNGRLFAVKEAFGPDCGRMGSIVISNDDADLRRVTEALLREVSALARISHPGVVRFEDVFEANGTICFAMDFVEGEALSNLLARRGFSSAGTLSTLSTSLLDAVEVLHANDVLHGDIKPANIIVRPDKSIVLIDFGTAARLSDVNYVEPILTPGYSPPERYVANGDVGAWSDVYSCAATLTAAMAGRPPPEAIANGDARTEMATFLGSAKDKFPDHGNWLTGAELGLSYDTRNRPASIAELRAAMGIEASSADRGLLLGASRGDGRSIFISYARADASIVEPLVRAIQRRGAGVWIDREGIKPGSRAWGMEILNGMRGAQIVLLFSSARSMASENVKDEVYLAKELRKPIVVARLDQAPFSEEILMFLARTQHISVFEMKPSVFAEAVVDTLSTEGVLAA